MSSARTHTYDGRRCTRQTRLRSVMPEVLCCISAVPVNATAITDQHTSRAYHSRSGAHSREILRLIKVMIVVTPFAFSPVPRPARGAARHYLYLLFRSGQDQEPMWLVGR